MLHNIYVFCLSVGVIYSAFSLAFHGLSATIDFGFDFELDFETNFDIFLPIKPFTVMVFLTVFGGSGLISEKCLSAIPAVVIALTVAYLAAVLLYRVVYVTLLRAQTETKGVSDAIGMEATILESIPLEGFGRISYIVDDNILSGVAKRLYEEKKEDSVLLDNDGRKIIKIDKRYKKGEKVYIWEVKDNVYYVALEPVKKEVIKASQNN